MTRQQKTDNAKTLAAALSRITGRHKRNTRDRGEYNGYEKSAVLKLIQKKKGYTYSESEKAAMVAYFDERLANMGESVSRGTPDWLIYDGGIAAKTTAIEPFMPCGSTECHPDKQR